jgi:MFS family permease
MSSRELLGALRERNFRLYFVGQSTSGIGSSMAPVAITFSVLQHGTASDVGYVAAAGMAPIVVFLLIGGVFADRFSQRVMMLGSDALRAVGQLCLAGWILLGTPPVWGYMVLAAIVGLGGAFFSPASTGLIPRVISPGRLTQANALNTLSFSLSGIIGPAIAGLVVATAQPGWAVLVDAVTYLVSVLSLWLIRIEWSSRLATTSMWHELRDGWREFWARTWLWVIVVEFSVVNILIVAPMTVLGPVVARQSLGGASRWGLVLAAQGAGAVVGGLIMLRWRPQRPLLVATASTLVWVWPLTALALRAPVVVIALGAAAGGAMMSIFGTIWNSTMQREIPADIISRVSAYDWFGSLVFLPLGLAITGPIDRAVGTTPAIVGAIVIMVVAVGAALCVPAITHMRAPVRGDGDEHH